MKALTIGHLRISFPVVLAPLAGYSDIAFRRICRRMGVAYASSEMILDRTVTARRRKPLPALATADDDHPVGGQLIGNDPEDMAAAAAKLAEIGFDVVDINFACPVNKALRRRRGGCLMKQPDLAVAIVRAVVAVAGVPVTVKLRKSFGEADGVGNCVRIAGGAREAGAAGIAVHGRSVERKYAGPADWDFLAGIAADFRDWTVVGSGDVLRPRDALDMLEKTGVHGVAVARGALGNPWFFRHVRDLAAGRQPTIPDLDEQRQVIEDHFTAAAALYGPGRASKIMRKFGIRYSRLHPAPKRVRTAFVAATCAAEWRAVLENHYRGT